MKEYDFRFPALSEIGPGDDANQARVREVRAALLEIAGGFTEILPGEFQDLLPGDGLGYIVALKTTQQVRALQIRLSSLALRWRARAPILSSASLGPRKDYCHFLLPEHANPNERGQRRPLFTAARWNSIEGAIKSRLTHRVSFVYGEWVAGDSAAFFSSDQSRIYVVRWESTATTAFLREFLHTYVFDGGKECDQWCLYLSIQGQSELILERK